MEGILYTTDDARSRLAAATPAKTAQPARPAQYFNFSEVAPTRVSATGSRTWAVRSQNLLLLWTEAVAGEQLIHHLVDEQVVLTLKDGARIRVRAGSFSISADEEAFTCIPPGPSVIEVVSPGPVVQLISTQNTEAAAIADNSETFVKADPNVAEWLAWPTAPSPRLRSYPISAYPLSAERFGRIFRTANIMVNFLAEQDGPRPPTKLSPHHHNDFEQLSLSVAGAWIHHIRYPWGPDATAWREDEHRPIGSPSVAIIPPPTIHTSQGVGHYQQLIDIFAPPRHDFADAGWVLNSDDYPSA